jgi:hypothetical protein
MRERRPSRLWLVPLGLLAACGDAAAPVNADGGTAAATADADTDPDTGGAGGSDAQRRPLPASDAAVATLDAGGQAAPSPTTFGSGLVLTDAAIEALMALTPEQRMQTASCPSGPVDGGIGLACTPRGRQCAATGLTCTADFRGDGGICTRLGCGLAPEDCGTGASCCTLLQAGGVSLCFPDACYPTTCLELFQ